MDGLEAIPFSACSAFTFYRGSGLFANDTSSTKNTQLSLVATYMSFTANISAQRSEKAVSHQAVCVGGIRVQRPIADGIDLQQALEHGASKAPGQGTCTACVVSRSDQLRKLYI